MFCVTHLAWRVNSGLHVAQEEQERCIQICYVANGVAEM